MGTASIQIIIIVAYIGVLFGISWYVKRRAAASAEEYVLAGRKLTTPLIMVSSPSAARPQSAWQNRLIRSVSPLAGIQQPGVSAPSSWD